MKSLWKCLNRSWRLFGTGGAFVCFALGGTVLSYVVFPLLSLLPGNKSEQVARAQLCIHLACKTFIRLVHSFDIVRITTEGTETLNVGDAKLIILNHPTLLDVVLIFSLMPRVDCVVKQSMWDNAYLKGAVLRAGYIVNIGTQALIDDCVSRLQQGHSLVVFPEGTRSPHGRLGKFQRGAAEIALRGGVSAVPAVVTCVPIVASKERPWYSIPLDVPRLRLRVFAPFDISAIVDESSESWEQRRKLTVFMQEFFETQVCNG